MVSVQLRASRARHGNCSGVRRQRRYNALEWRRMPLLTIHIVAIVGPDSGKHNSLPDCVVNCAPWHCPLLGPLLFLFCFLLSIIAFGQSCVTGVRNFLFQEISSVIYFLRWHIFSQSFIQPRKSLIVRNDVNEYDYLYV